MKQILTDLQGEKDSNTITMRDFNTPLTSMDRSSRQKINKETLALNDMLEHRDLTDIYRTFQPRSNRMHNLLKCTWNILQDRSYIRPENKS